jgi:predicted transcriptional regulator
MATQEEVLQAIVENNGVMSFKQLKEHFGIGKSGSSWLPQRLKSLESKKLIYRLRVGNETFFIADPDLVEFETRGRPAGTVCINTAMEQKLLNFVNERKIVTRWKLREGLGWCERTINKYVKSLIDKNMLIEWDTGTVRLYFTPKTLDSILADYYEKLYSNF